MQTLFVEKHRDAEPGVVDRIALNGIDECHGLSLIAKRLFEGAAWSFQIIRP